MPAPTASIVNRVWQVADPSDIAPGQLYVFLSEGTLVMASPHTTPSFGRWERQGDGLVLVEDGQRYPTDIVSLTADELRLRSHNPGTAVNMRLVPAPMPALGGAR